MTSKEFYKYAQDNGCSVTPISGINITGQSLRFVNNKNPKLYAHLSLPLSDKELPDKVISLLCIQLGIQLPPNF